MQQDEVLKYASYAQASYLDQGDLVSKFGSRIQLRELKRSRVRLILVPDESQEIQWIAVRGTANPKNVVVDLRVLIRHEKRLGVYLHRGFLRASSEALEAVKDMLEPQREVRITGHSLGGAVAQILAAHLAEDPRGYRVGQTVTFGQPMVTDANGAKVLKRYPILRVVNSWDPVAVLPLILFRHHFEFPPTIFFRHVGPQLTLYRNKSPRLSTASRFVRVTFGYKRLIANHGMGLYEDRLQAQVEGTGESGKLWGQSNGTE